MTLVRLLRLAQTLLVVMLLCHLQLQRNGLSVFHGGALRGTVKNVRDPIPLVDSNVHVACGAGGTSDTLGRIASAFGRIAPASAAFS